MTKKRHRRAERQWRATKLAVHMDIFKSECANISTMCKEAKKAYYCLKIAECGNDQKKIFNIANDLMNNKKDSVLPTAGSSQEMSEKFVDYFVDKIDNIKQLFGNDDQGNASDCLRLHGPAPPLCSVS